MVFLIRAFMFDNQVSNVFKSCYFELTLIAKVKPFHAFILSGHDYCNALYSGLSQYSECENIFDFIPPKKKKVDRGMADWTTKLSRQIWKDLI